jgi:hypothetical protein
MMATTSIRFTNSNEQTIYLQVDPWAGLYRLEKGDEIEIVADSGIDPPTFTIDEHRTTRILTILQSTEYFVVRKGVRVHWEEYPTNFDD